MAAVASRMRVHTRTYVRILDVARRAVVDLALFALVAQRSIRHIHTSAAIMYTKHTRDFESSHAGRDRNRESLAAAM